MYITFDEIMSYKMKVEGLQAENKRLNDKDGLYDEVKELQVENKRLNRVNAELSDKLQAVNDDYNNDHKVHNEYEDGLLAEIKALKEQVNDLMIDKDKLKADNKRLNNDNKKRLNEIIELQQDYKSLVKQVSSNRGSNSTHTISKEIDEYMSHNPKGMGARMFLIPRNEFAHGEYNHTIYWDDGIEQLIHAVVLQYISPDYNGRGFLLLDLSSNIN